LRLNWSKDAQSHDVMVVRKAATQSWTEPTQGTAYNAGNSIGSGVVVYRGGLLAYTNASLASDTVYDFKYYSENWSYYSAGVTAQGTTLATEPSQSPSAIEFSNIITNDGSYRMDVSWIGGDGAYSLVLCRQGSAPSADPADATKYAASTTYGNGAGLGSGYVCYTGTQNSVTLYGLNGGEYYHVAIYDFNGTNAPNYRTSDKLTGSQLVPEPACLLALAGVLLALRRAAQ
jgi:hypothetical protein